MTKIRIATPFDLLRIAINRRRQRVLHLNAPYTLVQPEALLTDMVNSRMPMRPQVSPIYVYLEHGAILGYIQGRCRWRRRDEWTITTLGTTEREPEDIWYALLEELCRDAGEQGIIRVFAKVPQDDPLADIFRGLGFTNYTNERIWGNLYFAVGGAPTDEPGRKPLRRQSSRDSWDIMQLYRAVTPPVAQHAESPISRQWHSTPMPKTSFFGQGLIENAYVWPDQSESERSGSTGLGGFVRLLTGSRGHWVTLMFRADRSNRGLCAQALDYVLWKAARLGTKPVYCAVREYQSELEGLLEDRGFHLLTEQSLLVKYIAEPIKAQQPALVPFLAHNKGELIATD